jgi:hypothetical protein
VARRLPFDPDKEIRMNIRHLAAAALVMSTAGCAYSTRATTTVNPKADLSNYDSFFLMKGNSSGSATVDDRLMSSVTGALLGKGWIEAPEGDGQAAVVVHTATEGTHTDESFYDGWGGWRWRLAGASNSAAASGDYKAGTVVVTLFDAGTKQAVWRGSAADAMPDGKRAKETEDKAVARIFDNFPDRPLAYSRPEAVTAAPVAAPAIIFSAAPSLLVLFDGAPVYRPVSGTELERIINTKLLIVRDTAGMCYLKIRDGWMQTPSLDSGWWSVSGVPPTGGPVALREAAASGTVDLLEGVNPPAAGGVAHLSDDTAPTVVVARAPAQLIVTDGPMVFAPIAGTALHYVVNTSADVFREPTDHELYVLTGGRWFRSWKPEGPWQAVASGELPADFARIPDGSPKAGVKASIAARGR